MNKSGIGHSHQSLGVLVREWRNRAGMSQLDLALTLGLSTRHLSFIETDKANPSESVLYAIVRALNVPVGERNTVFMAAGFRPRQLMLGDSKPPAESAKAILDRYLAESGPYPVLVKDAIWDVVHANVLAYALFSDLLGRNVRELQKPFNVLELVFKPDLLRPKLTNWDEVADSLILHIRHEIGFASDHLAFRDVVAEVSSEPGFRQRWDSIQIGEPAPRSTVYRFSHRGVELAFEAVLMSLGSPYDAVLRGIRLDNFLPLDPKTREFLANIRS